MSKSVKLSNGQDLLTAIIEAQLGLGRLNDLEVGEGLYEIKIEMRDKEETPGLTAAKGGKHYAASIKQLAALRVAVGNVTAKSADEWSRDPNGTVLKDLLKEDEKIREGFDTIRLKVVKTLTILNRMSLIAGEPLYKEGCYEWHLGYKEAVTDLMKGKDRSFYKTEEYLRAINPLRDKLAGSGLRNGFDKPENLRTLPVFEVIIG